MAVINGGHETTVAEQFSAADVLREFYRCEEKRGGFGQARFYSDLEMAKVLFN